jgi:hypothetical protein
MALIFDHNYSAKNRGVTAQLPSAVTWRRTLRVRFVDAVFDTYRQSSVLCTGNPQRRIYIQLKTRLEKAVEK